MSDETTARDARIAEIERLQGIASTRCTWNQWEVGALVVTHLPWLLTELRSALTRAREAEALLAELRARIRLLDNVCYSHHSASLVTWDGECPVCAEAGGITFYEENARLYRASISSEADQ